MEVEEEEEDSFVLDEAQYYADLQWQFHPLRAFLLKKIVSGEIPVDHKVMGPKDVWNLFCDDDAFEGTEYNSTFTSRLLALRKSVKEDNGRADKDIEAFEIAKSNHPPPAFNHRGEPQWNGSDAQRLLVEDMDNKLHFDLKPEHLWETREEYQLFHLTTFRDHVHQAHKTKKYLHHLKVKAKAKEEERREEARQSQKKAAEKVKKDNEKKERDAAAAAAKQVVKEQKEAERKAKAAAKEKEKKDKAEARATEKAAREQEKREKSAK